MIKLLIYLFLILCNFESLFSQKKNQLQKIVPKDRAKMDQFGWSVSLYNDYLVVGAPQKSIFPNFEVGSAYIFKKKFGQWKEIQKLEVNNSKSYNYFGCSVSINSSYAVVGAYGEDDFEDFNDNSIRQGSVYIYKKNESEKWIQTQKLSLDKPEKWDYFGYVVAISSQFIAVSAPGYRIAPDKIGAIFIYELENSGIWELSFVINPPESMLSFGRTLSICDSNLIIGHEDGISYVYKYYGKKNWQIKDKINKAQLSKKTNLTDNEFGKSVCISKNYLVVCADGDFDPYEGISKPNTDSLMIFMKEEKDGFSQVKVINNKRIRDSLKISPQEFKKHAKVVESTSSRKKRFGGAGSAYIFKKDTFGKWNFYQKIQAFDRSMDMHFGNCVSMSDSIIAVGAFGDKIKGSSIKNNLYAGSVYIFKLDKYGQWVQTKKLTSNMVKVWDKFGCSVAVDKKNVVIGSRFEDEDDKEECYLEDAGSVYIYSE